MADATLLNLVLYLPVVGIVLLLAVPPRREGAVRALSLGRDARCSSLLTACLYVHFDGAAPGLQFETRLPWIPTGACTTTSASTATTCCWSC